MIGWLLAAGLGVGYLVLRSTERAEAFHLQGGETYQLTIRFEPSLSGIDYSEVTRILSSQLSGNVGRMEPIAQGPGHAVMTVWMRAARPVTILKAPIHFAVSHVPITATVLGVKLDPHPSSMP